MPISCDPQRSQRYGQRYLAAAEDEVADCVDHRGLTPAGEL
jgi:hypothetical protein